MSSSPDVTSPAGPGTIPPDLRAAAVFAVDLAAVVIFVLLGRSSHGKDEALTGVLVTLWPFLSGMLVGWLALLVAGLQPMGYRAGLLLVVLTVGVGMTLRHSVSHDGTPVSFVIAASTFLSILYLGWRGVTQLIRRRRSSTSSWR